MIRHFCAALALLVAGCGSDEPPVTAQDRFTQSLRVCRVDDFSASMDGFGEVYYTVIGRQENDCLVQMVFIESVNATWVDQPLEILLREDRSPDMLRQTIAACLEGRAPQVNDGSCGGALMAVLGQAGTGGPAIANEEFSASGCGTPYEGGPANRFRMRDSDSGLWGYLDKDGNWAIPPRFNQATAFSEGLAAVLEGDGWQIIDPTGAVAIANVSKARDQSYTSIDGRNVYQSPIRPFSENCARLTNNRGLFYLSRDGRLWLDKPTAEMQTAARAVVGQIVDIGVFGADRASFSIDVNEFGMLDPKGYIDGAGQVAISPQYAQVGPFDDDAGLAPVGVAKGADSPFTDGYIYINTSGRKVLPRSGGRYKNADPFSEGLAVVRVDRDYQYIDKTGAFLTDEKFNVAQAFFGGMAYVRFQDDQYGWIDRSGRRVFTGKDIGQCGRDWPQANGFSDGLALVVIAKDESGCGDGQAVTLGGGTSTYENGEFAYVNTSGDIVFRESGLSAP